MTQTFTRLLLAAGFSVVLALPFGSAMLQPTAVHAATSTGQLGAEDLLDPDFGETAGLGQADLKQTIGQLIRVLLGFLGVVAVVIILLGGFKWMTASGNDEKVAEAKNLIIAGIIGLAIILSAYAIASFVISSIVSATSD